MGVSVWVGVSEGVIEAGTVVGVGLSTPVRSGVEVWSVGALRMAMIPAQ